MRNARVACGGGEKGGEGKGSRRSDRSFPRSLDRAFRRCPLKTTVPTPPHTHDLSPATPTNKNNTNTLPAFAAGLLPLLATSPALASPGGDNHLLTGQLVSLVHPAIMFFLFGASGWAGWLGWQWRRARELATEVKDLKATLPAAGADGVRPPSPVDATIKAKEEVRRKRVCVWYGDGWEYISCRLLGGASLGCSSSSCLHQPHPHNCPPVTLTPTLHHLPPPPNLHRNAKPSSRPACATSTPTGGPCCSPWALPSRSRAPPTPTCAPANCSPGPHLYAGAGIVILWAAAAALTPAMQKGNDSARSAHIALNTINLALFAWQIPTGLDIVAKVFQFTTLP